MNNKKSQAALEFLTTYAWAFLIILVVIGALAYFGVLRPSKMLPDRCNFGPEIGCQYYKLTYGNGSFTSGATLTLKNNVGEHITTTSINMSIERGTKLCTTNIGGWNAQEAKEVTLTNCGFSTNGLVQNQKEKVFVSITFYPTRATSTYTKIVNGEVYALVQ